MKQPKSKTEIAAISALSGVLLLLVGGVAFTLYQVNHHPFGQSEGYAPAQDPQMQELRRKAGIKD